MNACLERALRATTAVLALTAAFGPGPACSEPPGRGVPGGENPPAVPVAGAEDDPWEERKLRGREDVEYLEALRKAKLAECREAELRQAAALALKVDIDRQKQKGYASAFVIHQTELSMAENQSQLEMRRVELKEIDIRLARARRRLKAVERSPSAYEAESPAAEDRLHELELKYERLRREFELSRRVIDLQKTRP